MHSSDDPLQQCNQILTSKKTKPSPSQANNHHPQQMTNPSFPPTPHAVRVIHPPTVPSPLPGSRPRHMPDAIVVCLMSAVRGAFHPSLTVSPVSYSPPPRQGWGYGVIKPAHLPCCPPWREIPPTLPSSPPSLLSFLSPNKTPHTRNSPSQPASQISQVR